MSPFYNNGRTNNYDHFKSQCSEVIIRGSSETDISNRINRAKNAKENINSGGIHGNSNNSHKH